MKFLDEEIVCKQYEIMLKKLTDIKYINYEFCSFGKEGYFSKNNTAYWLRKKYIGIGPSAHSFDGISRSWNISNNNLLRNLCYSNILLLPEREKIYY